MNNSNFYLPHSITVLLRGFALAWSNRDENVVFFFYYQAPGAMTSKTSLKIHNSKVSKRPFPGNTVGVNNKYSNDLILKSALFFFLF